MSAEDDLSKKIKSVQDKLQENGKKVSSLFQEYKDVFTKENENFISKFNKLCEKRISFLSKVKDENKRSLFIDSNNELDKLLKEDEELISNLASALKALKTFLLNDPNIFKNENENENKKDEKSKYHKLIIKSTDDCGKAKNTLNSKEGAFLKKLEINRITIDDFNYLFGDYIKKKEHEGEDFNNQGEIIKIKKLKFKKSILLNINFCDYFPNINNLSISDCKIGYNICSKINFNNITRLSLEGVDLVNENFEDLLIYLLKDQTEKNGENYIGKNLELLSVKNNRISRILFPKDSSERKDIRNDFSKLEFLNLSGNNLFDFYFDNKETKPLFETVKLLDLTNNNITSPIIMKNLIDKKGQNCLILASKNIGVIKNNEMRKEYCEYLTEKLKNNYNIKSLVFEGIFGYRNKHLLLEMDLNHINSLVELNLSFNNIDDSEIISILEKNNKLVNLKRLNLSSNKITDQFFSMFVESKHYDNFKKLKFLNLSCNPIPFNEADVYKNFISNCQSLESLILKNTLIGEDINHYMKNKIIRFTAQKSGQRIGPLNKKDKEMESLIDKDKFLKNNSKVYIIISFIIKPKYVTYVNKYFPYLLERIKLEEE